jgi:hypothetical protein
MATQGTYFLNGTVWASGVQGSATIIYTDAGLTTPAANGWYKSGIVYRQATGSTGALGASASCTSCGTAFTLGYGSTAFVACCSGTTATFYLDTTSFTTATSVWTTPLMATKAANQFYSFSSQSRNKVSDSNFAAATACVTCYPAIGLSFSSADAATACCAGTAGTYYMNQTTFAASTILYTDGSGSTTASNGFYSYDAGSGGTVVNRPVTGGSGVLGTLANCAACATSISLCFGSSTDDVCCTGCATLGTVLGSGISDFNSVCSATPVSTTYYFNNTGTYPVAGDSVFTNSGGTVALGAGYYKINTAATSESWMKITGTNGYIAEVQDC